MQALLLEQQDGKLSHQYRLWTKVACRKAMSCG